MKILTPALPVVPLTNIRYADDKDKKKSEDIDEERGSRGGRWTSWDASFVRCFAIFWNIVKTLPEAQRTQGIDFISWVNLSPRIVQDWFQWHFLNWLQIWSPDGATWISSKFGYQIAPLAFVTNLVTRWRHLHLFKIWSPDGATWIISKFGHQIAPFALLQNLVNTCISSKFGHQMAPLALITNLFTR